MQTFPEKPLIANVVDCYYKEGISGFYKGFSLPFATASIVNAASLVGNEFSKSLIGSKSDKNLSVSSSFVCGALAGFFATFVTTPVELIKCKLQLQSEQKGSSYYKGVRDCLSKTYFNQGGIRGMYKGCVSTFYREVFGYAAQFGCYQYLKLKLIKMRNVEYDSISSIDIMLAGSFAGSFGWIVSYHYDFVKTLIQTQQKLNCDDKERSIKAMSYVEEHYCQSKKKILYNYKPYFFDGGVYSCFMHVYYSKGVSCFFKGLLPSSIGQFYSYGIMFLVYEKLKALYQA